MTPFDFYTRRRFVKTVLTATTALELHRAAVALGFSTQSTVCNLTPEQETGPFYLADEMERSNIRENKSGVPLSLKILLLDARTCKPLTGAAIDLWHCDPGGIYSGFTSQNHRGPGGPPPEGPPPGFDGGRPEDFGPPPTPHPTNKATFLRGIQMTAEDGSVRFETVFPGVYMGRTNHIHFKVRLGGSTSDKSFQAGHTSHTGQVFFPEDIAATLMQSGPYAQNHIPRTKQAEDMVFRGQQGGTSIATLRPMKPGPGFEAELVASVDPTAQPIGVGRGGARGWPPPPRF